MISEGNAELVQSGFCGAVIWAANEGDEGEAGGGVDEGRVRFGEEEGKKMGGEMDIGAVVCVDLEVNHGKIHARRLGEVEAALDT